MYRTILRLTVGIALALSIGLSVCYAQDAKAVVVKNVYPNLSTWGLSNAFLVALPIGVLLRSGELKLTQKDLDEEIRTNPEDIRPHYKKNLFYVLECIAVRLLLPIEAEALVKSSGKGEMKGDAAMELYVKELISNSRVSDEELKTFFEKNKWFAGGEPFEKVKNEIKGYLIRQKINTHVNSISERIKIEVDKDWAAKQDSAAKDNSIDNARSAGKPFIVEFTADYCKACKMMAPTIDSIKKKYADKMSVLIVDIKKEPVLSARYDCGPIPM